MAAWTTVTITIAFLIIKALVGLRVTAEEEILGLDATEHGLPSAYGGFDLHDRDGGEDLAVTGNVPIDVAVPVEQVQQSVPVVATAGASYGAYTKVDILCRQNQFEALKGALAQVGVTGMTVTQVMGCGNQKGKIEYYRGVPMTMSLHPKLKVEVVVSTVPVDQVIAAAKLALYTGHVGDGKLFVYNVENVVRIRTGEEGYAALVNEIEPAVAK